MGEPLWRVIAQKGYTASDTTLSRFIGQLRKDSGTARSFKRVQASAIYAWTGEQERRPPASWKVAKGQEVLTKCRPAVSKIRKSYFSAMFCHILAKS